MKRDKKYLITFTIKGAIIIEAESKIAAKKLFMEKRKTNLDTWFLQIKNIVEFDHQEAKA